MVLLFQLISGCAASGDELYWGIHEGDKVHYDLRVRDNYGNETIELALYFLVEDLSGIPYPLDTSTSPGVSVFCEDGISFEETEYSESIAQNYRLIDPIAMKLGNWSYIEEITVHILELTDSELRHGVSWVNETDSIWTFTTLYYSSSATGSFTTNNATRQFSKSNGLLLYGLAEYWWGSNGFVELTFTNYETTESIIPIIILIGTIGIITIVVVLIIRRR